MQIQYRNRRRRRAQRGMTLLEIMIVLAILALVMGLVVGPKVMKMFGQSRVDIAKMTVNKYANEAYPHWASEHPGKACPDSLQELNEYMNNKDTKDPWGSEYKMMCGQTLPPGARGLAVMSNGEDQKEGTTDDIKSWDLQQ
ncbi:MAG TPA: prepilin-type N-terminal cleavage/methylation domain-containing protein [Kofleriaceae bacterium]|jgi:general secretion pathway protein G|nr:prepilin-type N-terminal cleavage/methylation domain-containing protein [Kofleriaceae bacterium]